MDSAEIFPAAYDLCPESNDGWNRDQYQKPVCYSVANLDPNGNYTFQVSALNKVVPDFGPWSPEVHSMAEDHEGGSFLDAGHLMGMSAAMLAAVLGIVLLAVIFALAMSVFCAAEVKRRRKRYRNVPVYSSYRG